MLDAVLCTDGGLMGNGNLEKLSSIHNVNTPTSGEHRTQHRHIRQLGRAAARKVPAALSTEIDGPSCTGAEADFKTLLLGIKVTTVMHDALVSTFLVN